MKSLGKVSLSLQRTSFELSNSDKAMEVRVLKLVVGAMFLEEEIISIEEGINN